MPNFPIPTSGTAWASGGISGRISGGGNMQRRRGRRFVRREKKPNVWIPYMGNFNNAPWSEDYSITNTQLTSCAAEKRIVAFTPVMMDKSSYQAISPGDPDADSALGQGFVVRRVQGYVHFEGEFYSQVAGTPTILGDSGSWQQGITQRVWYAWVKERLANNGVPLNLSDMGVGPGVLADVRQLTNRHLLSWGIITWSPPSRIIATGIWQGSSDRRDYKIPFPRLPKAGLRIKSDESLSLICRASYGLGMGRDLQQDYANDRNLPYKFIFQPMMRFLCER